MVKSYVITCNVFEVEIHKDKVLNVVREEKCIGYGGEGDKVTFHFAENGQAMMAFLELDLFLQNLSISTNTKFIDETILKGVFKYD